MTEYGHSFAAWRKVTGTAWQDYVCHEFVTELGSGTLPNSAFLHYLVQDYLFLIHFSRAWALAVTKADDVAEMRACAATVNALVNDEISLHIRICAAAGIDEATLFFPPPKKPPIWPIRAMFLMLAIQVIFWI